jgi:hypothetical protein
MIIKHHHKKAAAKNLVLFHVAVDFMELFFTIRGKTPKKSIKIFSICI